MGDDNDDSIADDDWSLDSEESFYALLRGDRAGGLRPAGRPRYMYGEDVGDDAAAAKEDRFGVGRASAALASSMEGGRGAASDWDADVPVHDEKSGSSLHAFMHGSNGTATRAPRSTNHNLVARPVVGRGLGWTAAGSRKIRGRRVGPCPVQRFERRPAVRRFGPPKEG